jgi:hypothetical protein
MMSFADLVATELARARDRYRPMNSLHEGYAVILEGCEEMWQEIKRRPELRVKTRILQEAVQLAAMVQRMAEDCGLVEKTA